MSYERDNIRRMTGYTAGEQPADAATLKLNTNENPYPPSPRVQSRLNDLSVDSLRTYPHPTADPLRDLLGEVHEVLRENIVVTHGGDEALRLAVTTYVEPGTAFGMADPSYSLYPVLAEIQDARLVRVPLDDSWDLPRNFADELNEAGANLACIVNPHAPSGSLMDTDRISQLAQSFNGVLLIDEAYVDFVDPGLRHDAVRLIKAFDNLLILRTFSKGYSLAGLRLGYLIGAAPLIEPLVQKTRDSFNIDTISQALGEAAIIDRAYAEKIWANVRAARRLLRDDLLGLGFAVKSSQSNFLLAEVPLSSPMTAEQIYLALKTAGILVRYFDTPLLDDKLRITVGTEDQNRQLVAALRTILAS
ncbi:MAG: histidinol-phosphate transaminase [Gammaproteobacteria bacterium]|nr:histidinol-phosphate transaminase [Gammaproteobacteria bacterium]